MKIYYDNKCKICNKEIKFYKKFGVKKYRMDRHS